MANEVIRGCVNWSGATATVEFDQDECTYIGCLEWSGVHAGQVAVTINNGNCNDTYYADVNWSFNRWRMSIPEECCRGLVCNCGICAGTESGVCPDTVTCTISGFTDNDCCGVDIFGDCRRFTMDGFAAEFNGVHILARSGTCGWIKSWEIFSDFPTILGYAMLIPSECSSTSECNACNCAVNPGDIEHDFLSIGMSRLTSTSQRLLFGRITRGGNPHTAYTKTITVDSDADCNSGTFTGQDGAICDIDTLDVAIVVGGTSVIS